MHAKASPHSGGRVEDFRLVTGSGKYAADWRLPGQLHAHFLRSDRAHAAIVSVDTTLASRHPGVRRVYTGKDAMRAGYDRFLVMLNAPGRDGEPIRKPRRPALATDRVRHVGDAVAMVVADTAAAAQDAAELIEIACRDLPVVVSPERALADGAPRLHEEAPRNLAYDYETGDEQSVEAAFTRAAHVTRLRLEVTRVAPSPMELRGCTVAYDPKDDAYHLYVCIQGINMMRKQASFATGVPEERIHVHAADVGGGFGQRSAFYPEYAMQMLASRELGRPVRWISSRAEGFMTDTHGRGNIVTAGLALDGNGKFLAVRLDWVGDMGAYLSATGAASHTRNPTTCLTGVYRIPALYNRIRLVFTNTTPIAAYRGAGRPDIAYVLERVVTQAAAELGMDPAELRRRNFIPRGAFPYKTPNGATYEEADFAGCLDKALSAADWSGFERRRAEANRRARLRGIGLSTVIEPTGAGMFPKDQVLIECTAESVTVFSLAHSQGQSHETTFAMVVADALGVPMDKVRIRQSVQEKGLIGNHTGGSRSMVGQGSVCRLAALKLVEMTKARAAQKLGVEPSQVEYARGEFRSKESKKTVTLFGLAQGEPLSALAEATVGSTFPNGCHIAEVEVDPDTGVTRVVGYHAVDDSGNIVNHTVVEGQVHGAVTQGAGQVFGEKVTYDEHTGQLLTGSFMDYFMPRAGMLRAIGVADHPVPSATNALGAKGVGESGCTASLPALTNAVLDALRPLGIEHLDMPLTPNKVWHAICSAKAQVKAG
ncbi:MAG: xanthine dehydrogenase family protein [Burkholderiales bacterium]|nr:xanthine dehydrogenase family protein [Burkholderiales bacterium]